VAGVCVLLHGMAGTPADGGRALQCAAIVLLMNTYIEHTVSEYVLTLWRKGDAEGAPTTNEEAGKTHQQSFRRLISSAAIAVYYARIRYNTANGTTHTPSPFASPPATGIALTRFCVNAHDRSINISSSY
jgi:hypothetical protein